MKFGNPITDSGMKLVYEEDNSPVRFGDEVLDFRGDIHVVQLASAPHKSGSTGRVYTNMGEFFPGVIGAKWVKI